MLSPAAPRLPASRAPRRLRSIVILLGLLFTMPEAAFAAGAGDLTLGAHIARLANFAILIGALYYFLKGPIVTFLGNRYTQIRQDLVTAAEMRAAASAQLAGIQQRMQTLPGELDALRRQGAADVAAEQERIAQAAAAERERLLETTRREIDMRLRLALRELTEHTAALAVGIAEQRIRQSITADDQLRLMDRYTSQLHEAGSRSAAQ